MRTSQTRWGVLLGIAFGHFVAGWLLSMSLVFIALETPDTAAKPGLVAALHLLWLLGWGPASWLAAYVALPLWALIPLQAAGSVAIAWLVLKLWGRAHSR